MTLVPVSNVSKKRSLVPIDIDLAAGYILSVQKEDGEIPWSEKGKTDPWDHVECAMGLTVAGCHAAARRAYEWSCATQAVDGSWWSAYQAGAPEPGAHKDANMTAYIAAGVRHYFLATGDMDFLAFMWPTVKRAMDFVRQLQGPGGQIFWAQRADNTISQRALLTGSSAIYLSLCSAIEIARVLGKPVPAWEHAASRLGHAIRNKPQLFDQTKARYAMDWYYPILSGAISGAAARARVKKAWRRFMMDGWGIRCVSDQSWVTMAETAEVVITLATMAEYNMAQTLFEWIRTNQYENGAYWTGLTVPDRQIYTREQTTWTGAAVLLAADILYEISPACRLFSASPRPS